MVIFDSSLCFDCTLCYNFHFDVCYGSSVRCDDFSQLDVYPEYFD